jgi:hypothetical protein
MKPQLIPCHEKLNVSVTQNATANMEIGLSIVSNAAKPKRPRGMSSPPYTSLPRVALHLNSNARFLTLIDTAKIETGLCIVSLSYSHTDVE